MSEKLYSIEKKLELLNYLSDFVTDSRIQKMKAIAAKRTRYITVVLEDIYQSHNAAAVLRSCDCAGVQDIHIIENKYEFVPSKDVSIGAEKWLDMHFYKNGDNSTAECIHKLRELGYTICATTPHQPSIPISELDISTPIALIFGTEKTGLSANALSMSDKRVYLPMSGFSESLNISVTVALFIFTLVNKLTLDDACRLSFEEQIDLLIKWLVMTLKDGEQLMDKFLLK